MGHDRGEGECPGGGTILSPAVADTLCRMDHTILTVNDSSRARLEQLVANLEEGDFRQPVGGGEWTVAMGLAHLAYWDRRGKLILDRWSQGSVPPPDGPDWFTDLLNDALVPEWQAIPHHDAARLALEAAKAVDAAVAGLADSVAADITARGQIRRLARSMHRSEHLAEIERALGRF